MRLSELVESAIDTLSEYIRDNPNESESNYCDQISEIADGEVPIYNYDILDAVRNDFWLIDTQPEMDDYDSPLQGVKYNIYDHIHGELHNALQELRDELTPECDDCGTRFKQDDLHLMDDESFVCSDCSAEYLGDNAPNITADENGIAPCSNCGARHNLVDEMRETVYNGVDVLLCPACKGLPQFC